ncbi:MAG: TspO/MBR family protein [Lacisediminihabitans sp.]
MTRDVVRQVVVVISAAIAVVGSFIGSGAAGGTPIQDAAGGALAADATTIAPAGPAFSIWSVIYLGLIAYAIWQLLPRQRSDPRQRVLGYPIAVTLLLNAAWILSIQFGALALSVPIIVVLLAALVYAFFLTLRTRPKTAVEAIVADGTVGLYLGWVCVATAANITAFLVDAGFAGWGIPRDVWSVGVVAVAGAVGVLLAVRGRGRLAPAASLSWGLAWVAVARLGGEPHSVATGVAAVVAVVVVLVTTVAIRVRVTQGASPHVR